METHNLPRAEALQESNREIGTVADELLEA